MIFFVGLSLLAAAGGVARYRHSLRRRRRNRRRAGELLSDAMISQIEQHGWVRIEDDEPLDLKRIREEEKRFWNETAWDKPEPM